MLIRIQRGLREIRAKTTMVARYGNMVKNWLDNGSLVRLYAHNAPSPHAHYLCWRTGAMDRWEVAAFAEWLKKAVG
mgnify:CR=1 FL=1